MRTALLVFVLALASSVLPALPANADSCGIVWPPYCTVPSHLVVVGSNGSYGDIAGTFSVVVRDVCNRTMNCPVEVWFANVPYVRLCTNQLTPGLTMNCANRTLTRTASGGAADFRVIGDASPAECPSDPPGTVSIYACGVLIGSATVAVLDIDGEPGLSGGDLSAWLGGYFCNSTSPRLDYDGDGALGGGDLSIWLSFFNGGGSALGCTAGSCP
jgi:hypothetical protein